MDMPSNLFPCLDCRGDTYPDIPVFEKDGSIRIKVRCLEEEGQGTCNRPFSFYWMSREDAIAIFGEDEYINFQAKKWKGLIDRLDDPDVFNKFIGGE